MIAIVNVSPDTSPKTGVNQYEVRINREVIASFEHYRKRGGLAQCLRDAADAVERIGEMRKLLSLESANDKYLRENTEILTQMFAKTSKQKRKQNNGKETTVQRD
jgi:hypothetical protein